MWRIWRIYLYIDNLGKSFRGYNNFGETTLGILENVDFFQASSKLSLGAGQWGLSRGVL